MKDLQPFPSLQALGRQFDAIAERDAQARSRRRGLGGSVARAWLESMGRLAPVLRLAVALSAVALVAGGSYAVPATRGAVQDVFGTFSAWFSGDSGAAPGRPVRGGESLPTWVAMEDGEKRVLAEAGGEKLVAIRNDQKLTLALAEFGTTGTLEGFRKSLAGQQIMLVGPGRFIANGRNDRRPLFGLASSSVKEVHYNYLDGSPSVSDDDVAGAFGLVIETNRRPSSLTGYDATGKLIARLDLTQPYVGDYRYCPATGCPPWLK